MSNLTFTMVKPEAVEAGNTGAILNKIEKAGFRIVAMKKVLLSKERAGEFYAVHKERPFYGELVDYCLLYTSPSPRDVSLSRMPSSA